MESQIKFYTDENIPNAVAEALRLHGADVLTAFQAGNLMASDEVHWERACRERRTIITKDRDFLRMHAKDASHFGIAIADQDLSTKEIINGVLLIYGVMDAGEMTGHIEYL